ncbi:MAG: ATP-dependent zinc metalloprotease FtsH [Candidatus Zipacnadales bacterium]
MRSNQFVLILVLAVVALIVSQIPRLQQRQKTREYEYFSDFLKDWEAGQIASVTIVGNERARGQTTEKIPYTVKVPADPALWRDLQSKNPAPKIATESSAWTDRVIGIAGSFLLPVVLIFVFWMLMVKQMQAGSGQALSFGRSRHKTLSENFARVTFDDVAGMAEVKEEVQEIVDFLREPEKFRQLGAKIPRGVLLLGPPGCGKTLLARAIAGEANVAFFYISGSDFVEMFVGVGASRVRDLFEQAKHSLPAIIFIDEIDAVGRQRGAGLGGGHDEREQTLNALLVEMDGFDPNADVILLAATNRPDILDPALLRPGRFDRRIVVHNPDVRERREILELYLKSKPLEADVDVDVLAKRTVGFSGADIENLVNEAALLAGRRNKRTIGTEEFSEAVERVIAGPQRKSRVMSDRERKVLAYHEAGHALVGSHLPDFDPTYKVTILPRGMALGYTINLPEDDRYLMSRDDLLKHMCQALGGRVAEDIVFGDVTTGAQDDLQRVTELARQMVCEYGMSRELGPVTYGKKSGPIFLARDMIEERNYSEEIARKIDLEVRELIEGSMARARDILVEHRDQLDNLVKVLLEKETLEREEVEAVLKYGYLPEAEEIAEDSKGLSGASDESEVAKKPKEKTSPQLLPPPLPDLSGS